MASTLTRTHARPDFPDSRRPRRRPRRLGPLRGRTAVLWGIASFALLQGGLRFAIDHWLPDLRDPTFEIKARQFEQALSQHHGHKPLTVCMFGSSVTGRTFNGKYLESLVTQETGKPAVVFNMSDHAAGPLTHLVYLRRLLERNIRPDLVLVEVFPVVFNSRHEPADIIHFPAYRLARRDLEVVERYSADPGLRSEWRLGRMIPCYFHRFPIVHNLCLQLIGSAEQLPMWREYDDHGWYESPPLSADALQSNLEKVRITYREGLKDFRPGAETVHAFDETLALLSQNGIRAAVVMMPLGPTMRELTNSAGLGELKQTALAFCAKYQHTFLDAYTWLEEDMFNDSFHANAIGSKLFCERLATELIVPRLAAEKSVLKP